MVVYHRIADGQLFCKVDTPEQRAAVKSVLLYGVWDGSKRTSAIANYIGDKEIPELEEQVAAGTVQKFTNPDQFLAHFGLS